MSDCMIEVETLFSISEDDEFEIPVSDFIKEISASVEAMPEELRASAVIKVSAYDTAYIKLLREETPEEKASREANEARWAQHYRDEQHDAELAQYQRLKAKFG